MKTSYISTSLLFVTGFFACASTSSPAASQSMAPKPALPSPETPPETESPPSESNPVDPEPSSVAQEDSKEPAMKICLSPGHPSLEGDKLFEAIINRKVAYLLEDILLEANFETLVVTDDLKKQEIFSPGFKSESEFARSSLQVMTPEEKAQACNEWNADYVISIHHNHSPDKSTNHSLVFYGSREDFKPRFENAVHWAALTAANLGKTMKVTEYQSKSDLDSLGHQLTILQKTKMAGILTEASFYSNPKERKRLDDNLYLTNEAQAIFDGLVEYLEEKPGV